MTGSPLSGCIPIVLTPFEADGAIDLTSLTRQVDALLAAGVHGLATGAIASEGYKLDENERTLIASTVIERVNGRVPVVVSVDAHGTDLAARRARLAAAVGADALMVLPPFFIKPDEPSLVSYYARVAEESELPVMVQDAPQLTGVPIGVESLRRMNEANPLVCMVKLEGLPAAPKMSQVREALGEAMSVFAGWGGLAFMEGLHRGAVGCMPAANFGPALARVHDSFHAGRVTEAEQDFDALIPLMSWSMQSIDLGIWCAKETLRRAGLLTLAAMREPRVVPDADQQAEFERLLQTCPGGWSLEAISRRTP